MLQVLFEKVTQTLDVFFPLPNKRRNFITDMEVRVTTAQSHLSIPKREKLLLLREIK